MTVIATSRLVLRPLFEGDADDLVRELNNFAVSRWTARIPFPYAAEHAAEFLGVCARGEPGTLRLAVTLEGRLIGVASYEPAAGGAAEIGYWIAEPHWGKGYATEAARALADHAFEHGGYGVMTARYGLGNEASRRILLDLGFAEDGVEKSFSRATGAETQVMRLTLTKAAWRAAKGRRR